MMSDTGCRCGKTYERYDAKSDKAYWCDSCDAHAAACTRDEHRPGQCDLNRRTRK